MTYNAFIEMVERVNNAKAVNAPISKDDYDTIASNYLERALCHNGHTMYVFKLKGITFTIIPFMYGDEYHIYDISYYDENECSISYNDMKKAFA